MEDKGSRMEYEWRIKVEEWNMNGGWRLKRGIWMDDEGWRKEYEKRMEV